MAIALARDLGAHLTALYLKHPIEIPLYADVTIPQSVFDQAEEYEQEKLKAARSKFDRIVHDQPVPVEWRQAEGRTGEKLMHRTRWMSMKTWPTG